ncbi:FAD-dependent oxidoreductase [Kitasatospora sp. NPDC056076]|uniref:FAD-dependent oxidoreductase n=1 Tax=Kitasatospora sp. NPDC056076 TaxID=3345703 RepID=UPI0035DCFEE4
MTEFAQAPARGGRSRERGHAERAGQTNGAFTVLPPLIRRPSPSLRRSWRDLDRLDPVQRRRAVLGPLSPHIGPEVLEPVSRHEKAWHLDEHVGGGYIALPELGTPASVLPMSATPVGRIHWAGAETASEHPGYLEGAIEAGRRAASEVIDALANQDRARETGHVA